MAVGGAAGRWAVNSPLSRISRRPRLVVDSVTACGYIVVVSTAKLNGR